MRNLAAVALMFFVAACNVSTVMQSGRPPGEQSPIADTSAVLPSDSPRQSPPPTQWTALRWAAPALLAPYETVSDVVAWGSAYVAVGQQQVLTGNGGSQAAAWISTDWRTWNRTLLDVPPIGSSTLLRVLGIGSVLVAIGTSGIEHCVPPTGEGQVCDPLPVALWDSTDGRTWLRAPLPKSFAGASIADIASNSDRLLLVGDTGWDAAGIWTSTDGITWERETLPAGVFGSAHLRDVAAIHGGFVLTGSTGGSKPICCAGSPADSTPAAWFSANGISWQADTVDGAAAASGDSIARVFVGRAGAVAWGGSDTSTGWSSPDGRHWSALAAQKAPYQITPRASDGDRIIGDSYAGGGHIAIFQSDAGTSWRQLAATGAIDQVPAWDPANGPTEDAAYLFPSGVGFIGQNRTTSTPLWFATADPGG